MTTRRHPRSKIVWAEDGEWVFEDAIVVHDETHLIETGLFTHDNRKLLRLSNPRSIGFHADMDVGPAYVATAEIHEPEDGYEEDYEE